MKINFNEKMKGYFKEQKLSTRRKWKIKFKKSTLNIYLQTNNNDELNANMYWGVENAGTFSRQDITSLLCRQEEHTIYHFVSYI